MALQKIPVNSDPDQSFDCAVDVDGKNITLKLNFKYNEVAEYWIMKVSDSDSVLLIDSIPLLGGTYPDNNLLDQYSYLGIGSAYIVKSSTLDSDYPDSTNLGTGYYLLWGDNI